MELTLAAYTVPKEAYQKAVIPAFQAYWLNKTGQKVVFKESYTASGAQAQAITSGLEADIAALSLAADVDTVKKAGLITHDWRQQPYGGTITRSVVAIGVKLGNPLQIRTWTDLSRPGVTVLYPNPRTSGGAMWDIMAIYGAGLKSNPADPEKGARELIAAIHKNVKVMDKSGRESMTTFEKGLGDAVVTYENELLLRNMESPRYDIIYPDATMLIENPVAVVDKNVDKHGTRQVAEAFVEFLWSEAAQDGFATYGFRPVNETVSARYNSKYPVPKNLFDITSLGGWNQVEQAVFGPAGAWTQIVESKG